MKKAEEKKHESFGMIEISKFSSNGSQYFGSDILQNGGVTLKINRASVKRDLHREWFHSDENVITVRMSRNQFVDAITSGMNTSGVPCTLESLNGKRIEQTI